MPMGQPKQVICAIPIQTGLGAELGMKVLTSLLVLLPFDHANSPKLSWNCAKSNIRQRPALPGSYEPAKAVGITREGTHNSF